MTKRRKFLLGMGSLAAGGAAAMGSGAFAVNRFDRTLNVDISGDASAYLALVPDSDYAHLSGGKLNLDFSELNQNADTSFRNVFYIQNNGTNSIKVQLIDGVDHPQPTTVDFANNSPLVVSYTDNRDTDVGYSNLNVFPNSPNWIGDESWGHAGDDSANANSGHLELDPGDTAVIHFDFFLRDDNQYSKSNDNTSGEPDNPQDIDYVPDEIGFYASALPEDGAL